MVLVFVYLFLFNTLFNNLNKNHLCASFYNVLDLTYSSESILRTERLAINFTIDSSL